MAVHRWVCFFLLDWQQSASAVIHCGFHLEVRKCKPCLHADNGFNLRSTSERFHIHEQSLSVSLSQLPLHCCGTMRPLGSTASWGFKMSRWGQSTRALFKHHRQSCCPSSCCLSNCLSDLLFHIMADSSTRKTDH